MLLNLLNGLFVLYDQVVLFLFWQFSFVSPGMLIFGSVVVQWLALVIDFVQLSFGQENWLRYVIVAVLLKVGRWGRVSGESVSVECWVVSHKFGRCAVSAPPKKTNLIHLVLSHVWVKQIGVIFFGRFLHDFIDVKLSLPLRAEVFSRWQIQIPRVTWVRCLRCVLSCSPWTH